MGYFEDCKAAFLRAKSEDDLNTASLMLEDVDFNALPAKHQAELTLLEHQLWAKFEVEEASQWAAPV